MIVIRPLTKTETEENIDKIMEIAADIDGEYWEKKNFLMPLPDKWVLSLAAWNIHLPIGYAIVSRKGEAVAHLHHLMVRYEYRSQGLGTKLLKQAETRAQALGISELTLKVIVNNNRAQRFYERLGFIQIETEGDYQLWRKRIASQ